MDLRAIMYQPDPIRTRAAIQRFRIDFSHLTEMMEYLDTYYFAEGKTNWMLSERQGVYHAQIHTNNFVESWHRTLKVRFFHQRRAKRVDRVIYTLSHQATPFFYRKTVESSVGVGRVSKKQKKVWASHDRAFDHFTHKKRNGHQGSLVKLVDLTDTNTFEVQSFSDPTVKYQISSEPGDGPLPVFTACSCLDFQTRKQVCKHIALSMFELPGYEFREPTEPKVVIQAGLDEVVEQEEGPAAEEGTQEQKEANDLIQEMVSLLKGINVKALGRNEEAVRSLKRSRELLDNLPENLFRLKRQRQPRF